LTGGIYQLPKVDEGRSFEIKGHRQTFALFSGTRQVSTL